MTDQKVPERVHDYLNENHRAPENYTGLTNMTGRAEVEVLVGADGNRGHYAFDPAAVLIDDGTTVTWRWTGDGGAHQVQGTLDASFESRLTAEKGHTFSREFTLEPPNEDGGLYAYECSQHDESKGERGAIVVGPCCGQYPDPTDEVPGN
ncbi:halocyanin domain-containing protein [Halosimplex amylolyticum]|uniref:halocyanin domain-containing protein n=1 Tax=Halosimplex amylolyticum TaxID=3396616 RepID=UPI003F54302F